MEGEAKMIFKKGDIVSFSDTDSPVIGIVRACRSDYNGKIYQVCWFSDNMEANYRYWDLNLVCEAKVQ
jgi:hypothetical protein